MATSAYTLAKRLDADILRVIASAQSLGLVEQANRRLLADLKHNLTDTRLDVRDYELAETKSEQVQLAHGARERLGVVREAILVASQYNIFSAIEVARLSAMIQQLQEQLD